MEQSNTGVTSEYTGYSYQGRPFPYHFNFEKCQIKWQIGMDHYYVMNNYNVSTKNRVYEKFASENRWNRQMFCVKNNIGTNFVVGYRSLFKIVNDILIPIAIIDHNLDLHIQSDVFIDRWEKGLLKMIVTGATGEVTLHDNLAGEFFLHPNAKFKNLKEKREIEELFTAKLIETYTLNANTIEYVPDHHAVRNAELEAVISQRVDEILDEERLNGIIDEEDEQPF